MKTFLFGVFSLLLISVLFSRCGVMFGGSKYHASILAKDHPNAHIYVDGNKIGQGSATGLFSRNRLLSVELRQEGCEPKTQIFDKTLRTGNFILSIISWGLIGVAVDLGTGSAYKPDHKTNSAIQRLTVKDYSFTVDYSGCPVK